MEDVINVRVASGDLQHIGSSHACEGGFGKWGFTAHSRSAESRDHCDDRVKDSGCRGMESGCLDMVGVNTYDGGLRER